MFTFYLLCGNLLQVSSLFFFCYSSASLSLSLPPSLCLFILQSYKKAIDEVSDTRVPFLFFFFFLNYPGFPLPLIFRAPPPLLFLFFPPLAWWSFTRNESLFLFDFQISGFNGDGSACVLLHTYLRECMWTRACAGGCVCMHAGVMRGCVCVCVTRTAKHLKKSLNLFSCFSIVLVTGQEELVSPPCMTVPKPPVCMTWSDPSAGVNEEGRVGRSHGPVGMGVISRGGVD